MKKFLFLVPVIMVVLFTMVSTRMFASGSVSPTTLVIIMVVFFAIMMLVRPKKAAPKPAADIEKNVRGEFAKDAFADNVPLQSKFQAALKDYSNSMPKACLSKLTKLAPQCTTKEETYAVAMATAMCLCTLNKYSEAIRQYNKAIVLHPTAEVALTLGSCHQRLGELNKARDSYEFALDLDSGNVEARSILATTYVADGDYETALDHAALALDKDPNHASALATTAICYGLLDDPIMSKRFADLAVENGYSQKKITDTISALKKRK